MRPLLVTQLLLCCWYCGALSKYGLLGCELRDQFAGQVNCFLDRATGPACLCSWVMNPQRMCAQRCFLLSCDGTSYLIYEATACLDNGSHTSLYNMKRMCRLACNEVAGGPAPICRAFDSSCDSWLIKLHISHGTVTCSACNRLCSCMYRCTQTDHTVYSGSLESGFSFVEGGLQLLLPKLDCDMQSCVLQVALLSPVAASNEALHAQLNDLRKDLSQAQVEAALLSPETSRANAAEARCRQLEAELSTTSSRLSDVEDQLRSTAQSLKEVQGRQGSSVFQVTCQSLSSILFWCEIGCGISNKSCCR